MEGPMNLTELNKVAEAMVAPGKGILAADESTGTIKKRFESIGVDSTANTRRDYRELLFRSTEPMSKYISGVILYDETIRQTANDGTPLIKLIERAGSIPGIKVDKGTKPLPLCPGEVITEGLDGLRGRQIQRARARALCGTVPGAGYRAHRRAGSADGRQPRRRSLLSGHRMGA